MAVDMEAHIRQVVSEAPPLTNEQRDRIALILRGDAPLPYWPAPVEPTEQELQRAKLTETAKRIAAELQACVICGTPIFVHPKVRGHEWEPNALAIGKYTAASERSE